MTQARPAPRYDEAWRSYPWGETDFATIVATEAANRVLRPLALARNSLSLPRPSPDEPDRFRFSGPGELAAQLRQAGFREVRERVHDLPVEWTGTVTERWATALRNNRRIARAVAALPDTQRETLERKVLDAFRAEEARGDEATVAVVVAVGVR